MLHINSTCWYNLAPSLPTLVLHSLSLHWNLPTLGILARSTDQRNLCISCLHGDFLAAFSRTFLLDSWEWSEMLSHLSNFYRPSHCTIGHIPSTIAIISNAFHCSALCTSFGRVCVTIVAFRCTVMFLLLKFLSHTVADSMFNGWLIPIVTSNRVVVVIDRSVGCFVLSSDIPSTSFSKRYSKWWRTVMMKPQKTQCIKHILEFHIGYGKGVTTSLNKAIIEYPIQLVQI